MKAVVRSIVFAAMLVFGTVLIGQAAPLDDAKVLSEKAAAYVKSHGKEKGIAEIGNPKGQFVKGDLYVVIQDFNGINLANPMQPKLAGKSFYDVRDANGKFFIREMIELAKTKGSGWASYNWTNPATNKVQTKKSWVQRVEGTDLYVLSGVYQ